MLVQLHQEKHKCRHSADLICFLGGRNQAQGVSQVSATAHLRGPSNSFVKRGATGGTFTGPFTLLPFHPDRCSRDTA